MMTVAVDVNRSEWPYRMKDLVDLTGIPRQVVHFYIQQGLLPEGNKTGRNMAYYREEHLARLRLIRELQHERFLPLKAIKAIFDQRDSAFTPAQHKMLHDVKNRLANTLGDGRSRREHVNAREVCERTGVTEKELREMVEVGVLGATEDDKGNTLIARDDSWMLELWSQLRSAGFSRELGFTPADMKVFEEAISVLFKHESELLTQRLAHLPPDQVAQMVERALPLINTFLTRFHEMTIRNFFAAV